MLGELKESKLFLFLPLMDETDVVANTVEKIAAVISVTNPLVAEGREMIIENSKCCFAGGGKRYLEKSSS